MASKGFTAWQDCNGPHPDLGGHASNQAIAVDRTDAGPGRGEHIQESALRTALIEGKSMGGSHLSRVTAPDCQPLTEQPGKDL